MRIFWRFAFTLSGLCLWAAILMISLSRQNSPIGYWLYFVNGVDGQIYRQWVVPAERRGLAPRQITTSPGIKQQLSGYQDWLIFSGFNEGAYDIFKMRMDGSELQNLTNRPAWDQMPRWSPDGEWIAFSSDADESSELYRMRPDGSELQRLTHNSAADTMPTWSPDSRQLLYQSTLDDKAELYILELATGKSERLTHNSSYDGQADWSPTGIIWVSSGLANNNFQLYQMQADGSKVKPLTDAYFKEGFYDPRWSPDGKWITFWGGHPGNFGVHIMAADRQSDWIINQGHHFLTPAWLPLKDLAWRPLLLGLVGLLFWGLARYA